LSRKTHQPLGEIRRGVFCFWNRRHVNKKRTSAQISQIEFEETRELKYVVVVSVKSADAFTPNLGPCGSGCVEVVVYDDAARKSVPNAVNRRTVCRTATAGMLGFSWRATVRAPRPEMLTAPRGATREFAMYPILPTELLLGAIELVCYFFTMLAAVVGCLLVRP
jgi:hypothetical protein